MLKIEQLLFKGFITRKININGINIILKSLNQNEVNEISQNLSKDKKQIFYDIIYSIYKINNINILPIRDEYLNELYDAFSRLNLFLINKIVEAINTITVYINEQSGIDFKNYINSDSNKDRFSIYNSSNIPLNDPKFTAIQGTDLLGLNIFQEAWINLNSIMRSNEESKEKWETVKFICTLINPKAMKMIDTKDPEKVKSNIQLSPDITTREGIIKELRKQIRGEKDLHDVIIEKYEKAVTNEFNNGIEKERIKGEEKAKELKIEKGEMLSSFKVIDINELNKIVKDRKERMNSAKFEIKKKAEDAVNKDLKDFKEKNKDKE